MISFGSGLVLVLVISLSLRGPAHRAAARPARAAALAAGCAGGTCSGGLLGATFVAGPGPRRAAARRRHVHRARASRGTRPPRCSPTARASVPAAGARHGAVAWSPQSAPSLAVALAVSGRLSAGDLVLWAVAARAAGRCWRRACSRRSTGRSRCARASRWSPRWATSCVGTAGLLRRARVEHLRSGTAGAPPPTPWESPVLWLGGAIGVAFILVRGDRRATAGRAAAQPAHHRRAAHRIARVRPGCSRRRARSSAGSWSPAWCSRGLRRRVRRLPAADGSTPVARAPARPQAPGPRPRARPGRVRRCCHGRLASRAAQRRAAARTRSTTPSSPRSSRPSPPVNAMADAADGFVWRLQEESGRRHRAAPVRRRHDRQPERVGRRRDPARITSSETGTRRCCAAGGSTSSRWRRPASWPGGCRPVTGRTWSRRGDRLERLRSHGPTAYAFTLRTAFPPEEPEHRADAAAPQRDAAAAAASRTTSIPVVTTSSVVSLMRLSAWRATWGWLRGVDAPERLHPVVVRPARARVVHAARRRGARERQHIAGVDAVETNGRRRRPGLPRRARRARSRSRAARPGRWSSEFRPPRRCSGGRRITRP